MEKIKAEEIKAEELPKTKKARFSVDEISEKKLEFNKIIPEKITHF
jgi:hypothetical protein